MARQRSSAQIITAASVIVGVLFFVKGFEILFQTSFQTHGILPRTQSGLLGIIWSPFLHANWDHLLANSVPLFVLLILLLSNSNYRPYATLLLIWFISGLGTWAIGRGGAYHIGASSVVFGLAGFLIFAGFYLKSWRCFFVSVFVVLLYGGIFYGALPQSGPISWEGHLSGVIAGILRARGLERKA